jgi:hypothetical protein
MFACCSHNRNGPLRQPSERDERAIVLSTIREGVLVTSAASPQAAVRGDSSSMDEGYRLSDGPVWRV